MHRMEGLNIDSKFRLILIAAERAEQLLNGARPKIPFAGTKLARGAMEEVLQGLIRWEYGPAPELQIEEREAEASVEDPAR